VDCSLQVGTLCLLQAKEFSCLGVLFTSEGKTERIGAAAAVKTGAAPDRLGEEGSEPEGETLNLLVGLLSNPHLRP